ncbi:MAG: transcription repressor NadR [Clostridia bacterium]|nr:transcription repressor NadR [Clostridia bacterium]
MKADERRKAISFLLLSEQRAISGDELAERFGVSRQSIVQDISVLRESGYEIAPTHHGYLVKKSPLKERVFKVRHSREDTADELMSIVGLGGTVVDVYVLHKVYGKISAPLNIYTEEGVKSFIDSVRSGKSSELMSITDGYHYHTVRAETDDILDSVALMLYEKKYLVPEV